MAWTGLGTSSGGGVMSGFQLGPAAPRPRLRLACWNIQTLSADKAKAFATEIAATLFHAVRCGSPVDGFVAFILEVSSGAASGTILNTIKASLRPLLHPPLDGAAVDVGGSSTTRESIITLWGGAVTGVTCRPAQAWKPLWESNKAEIDARLEQNFITMKLRSGAAKETTLASGAIFRSPVLCSFGHNNRLYRVLAMHAPGPSHGKNYPASMPFAPIFLGCVLRSTDAQNANVVMGDFNLYGEDLHDYEALQGIDNFADVSSITGGTTFTEAEFQSRSRLDRVLFSTAFQPDTASFSVIRPEGGPKVSDHWCMSCDLP